jgi:hypothetical protein
VTTATSWYRVTSTIPTENIATITVRSPSRSAQEAFFPACA